MGQKVHPTGLRLGYNKPWRSRWFAAADYAKLLHEDLKLKKDLKARFQGFSTDVDALTAANSKLARAVASLKTTADARFSAWDSENATLTDREVRTHAEQRRDEVFAVWNKTELSIDQGAAFANSVAAQFADLRKMLASDLSPGGVDAASGLAGKARSEAEKLLGSTKGWIERLDAAIESASTGPTSPPPAK